MYWIPAIFIFFEIIIIYLTNDISKYDSLIKLQDKYNDKDLSKYISVNYKSWSFERVTDIIFIVYILEFIYFIVGLFFSYWIISIVYILGIILFNIYNDLYGDDSVETLIKMSKLKNFKSSNVQFDRLLKLNELNKDFKITEWTKYIVPTLKLSVFLLIITLHYNINLNGNSTQIIEKNRRGYYEQVNNLTSEEHKNDATSGDTYKSIVFVEEIEKYTNGMSKIKLVDINVVSGFDPNKVDWIKTIIKTQFSTIRKTSDIEWIKNDIK